jgi:hypothetical protein
MLPILKGMTKGSTRGQRGRNRYIAPVAALVMFILIGQVFWLSSNRDMFSPFSISRIPCATCAKFGMVRDEVDSSIMKMCPVCFGIGYNTVRRFDELDGICAACGGMGRVDEDGAWRTCNRCDGRGVHRLEVWQKIVPVESASQ